MIQTGFVAALDLGTSKIKGVVGRMNENNVISVLACETVPSKQCIRRGVVYNVEETGANVKKLISMLENVIGRNIAKVYVSVAGQSLHTIPYRTYRQLSSSGIVTENVINQLNDEAQKFKPDLSRKYAIADVEYYVDRKPEKNPVGITCSMVEAEYQMLVGRPNLVANIEKGIVERANVRIAGYIVGAQASAAISLNDDEKELGCVFIDFGAGTTTVSIYKGGVLRRTVVIPFGGKTITRDICELNFTETDAEQYKIKFGKAVDSNESSLFSPFSSKADIDLVELNKVIRMRLDEITANINEQIRLSGYEGQLGAGIVITGGASQLKNLDLYLKEKFNMPVRKASAKKSFVNNAPEIANDPSFTQVLGLLLFGTEDCEVVEVEPEGEELESQTKSSKNLFGKQSHRNEGIKTPKKSKTDKNNKGIKTTLGGFFSSMFSEEEDE
ncbi:MAG: cell division protein FtsA [Dysgonomonadaceae bacterium]|jgi:cell division protein FtsA|nr:cell division protein FtsA [Dysgonamonadaceae bacterium]